MKIDRDRAEGWQHAKISGHVNENNVMELIKNDLSVQRRIIEKAGYSVSAVHIVNIEIGGLHELHVSSVLGDFTKNKSDASLLLSNGEHINISIKKSLAGQVYLIAPDRFIEGFSLLYNTTIPDNVKRAIELYWGVSDDIPLLLRKYSSGFDKIDAYQTRKHRLVKCSLDKYDKNLSVALLNWINDNIENIFEFCFARGLARDSNNSADLIWYINTLGENKVDNIFNIKHIKSIIPKNAFYGKIGGGTTIQLPFGFVQWHNPSHKCPCMQFHHDYKKLLLLTEKQKVYQHPEAYYHMVAEQS